MENYQGAIPPPKWQRVCTVCIVDFIRDFSASSPFVR